MKKNKLNILILILLVSLSGCDNFLDKVPEDTLSPGVYYNNVTELKTGLSGCYKELQSIYAYNGMIIDMGISSDDAKDRNMMDPRYTFLKTNSNSASEIWTSNYSMISRINAFLETISLYVPADGETAEVNAMIGECHFLRGLAYMNLVRVYGAVPMVTTKIGPSNAFGILRTPVETVYKEVIIPDFENAFENCYTKGSNNLSGSEARATKGSALMGLAQAQMETHDYTSAQSTLKKFIVDKDAGEEYGLMDNLADVFDCNNKFNKESIFEVNYNVSAGQPSYYYTNMTNDIGALIGAEYHGNFMGSHNFLKEFTDYGETERLNYTVDSGFVEGAIPEVQAFPKKMCPQTRAERIVLKNKGSDYNFIVFRYADALLMYAECLMRSGDNPTAIGYINQVRNRSDMVSLDTNFDLDIYWILHERRMELAFECHRFWDLKRTGKAIEIISKALMTVCGEDIVIQHQPIKEYQLLFPIPAGQIEIDQTLTQNPGY